MTNPVAHLLTHREQGPPKVADQAGKGFNAWLALKITSGVGTMWCAYVFAILAFVSLPDAIKGGRPALISWVAQTFIQLVLLSIIMVGQDLAAKASDARADSTYKDAEAVLALALRIEQHLESQDAAIAEMLKASK